MDHIQFPYRAKSHLALMHVIAEIGAWERHNLNVDYERQINREDAHELVPKASVEFVSGNHVSTYAARARGDQWVYVGQSMSENSMALVTRHETGINRLKDVRFRRFGSQGRHPGLNTWLYLKQRGLDPDLDQVEIIKTSSHAAPANTGNRKPLLEMVMDGDVDACFLNEPKIAMAREAGLKVIELEPMAMINYMTLSTSKKLVDTRPDIISNVLKATIEGVAYFKLNREATIEIIQRRFGEEGKLDRNVAEQVYNNLAPFLDPRLYPSLPAISNVYEEAVKQDKDAARIRPLSLWNLHFLREIDDSGFIDELYKSDPSHLITHGG